MVISSELPDEALLQKRLEEIFENVERKDVLVCCQIENEFAFAAVGPNGKNGNLSQLFQAACLTRLFTATLLEHLISQGTIGRHDKVLSFVGTSGIANELLDRITIQHLLDHTHGLDDSACMAVNRRADGFIDTDGLLLSCAGTRLSEPGETFSYSNIGAWIGAAILERWYDMPYANILRRELFDCLGLKLSRNDAFRTKSGNRHICPAAGGPLAVSIGDLSLFLAFATARKDFWPSNGEQAEIVRLPGWNPFERGIFRGWKVYENGWYGHNSVAGDGKTAAVRISPERKTALAVVSTYHHASIVLAKLFGKSLRSFARISVPRRLSKDECGQRSFRPYCGTYGNVARKFELVAPDGRQLELVGSNGQVGLVPAENDLFFASGATLNNLRVSTFVQLPTRQGGTCRFVWDGRRIYPNAAISRSEWRSR